MFVDGTDVCVILYFAMMNAGFSQVAEEVSRFSLSLYCTNLTPGSLPPL